MNLLDVVQGTPFYVVVNSDGQFFRRKGYGGYGNTWVDTLDTARVYVKIGQARSVVTFFANNYPQYPVPSLVKMTIGAVEILDETLRVAKAQAAQERAAARREERNRQEAVDRAQRALDQAQERLKRLRKK